AALNLGDGDIYVLDGNTVTVEYFDPLNVAGAAQTFTDTATWNTGVASDTISTLTFVEKWNLFSIDRFNTTVNLTAKWIKDNISLAAGSDICVAIVYWDGANYQSYTGSIADNFDILVHYGYWLYIEIGTGPVSIDIWGLNRGDYEIWDAVPGQGDGPLGDGMADGLLTTPLFNSGGAGQTYNLVGWFNSTTPQVEVWMNLTADSFWLGARGFIYSWDGGAQAYSDPAIQLDGGIPAGTANDGIPDLVTETWTLDDQLGYWMAVCSATEVTY
ncbi:MAG: hypothetical protein KAT70_01210, partial [Thermoplasmata archaeon]|nr:hypothetical protein [Thermoplasmata archaeon]